MQVYEVRPDTDFPDQQEILTKQLSKNQENFWNPKTWNSKKNTMRNPSQAGHMVPMDQPKVALQMMSDFVPWMIQLQQQMRTYFSNLGGQLSWTLSKESKEGQFTCNICDSICVLKQEPTGEIRQRILLGLTNNHNQVVSGLLWSSPSLWPSRWPSVNKHIVGIETTRDMR